MSGATPYTFKNYLIMPNWCLTSHVVTGDEKQVCDLYNKMKSLEERNESLVKNGFGKTWLGNLIALLGGDWETTYCRGEWQNLQKDCDDGALRFDTMSAWGEPDATIAFLRQQYPNLDFYFLAEEPGCEYYVTNDADGKHFPERYYFAMPDDYEPYWYDKDELDKFLHDVGNFLGRTVSSAEEAKNAIHAYNEDKVWEECAEVRIYNVVYP